MLNPDNEDTDTSRHICHALSWAFAGSMKDVLHAGAGESYEESATREIEEEMGISGVTLTKCFEFFYRDKMAQHFGGVFSCQYDGPLKLDPQEVESAEWRDVQVCFCSTYCQCVLV